MDAPESGQAADHAAKKAEQEATERSGVRGPWTGQRRSTCARIAREDRSTLTILGELPGSYPGHACHTDTNSRGTLRSQAPGDPWDVHRPHRPHRPPKVPHGAIETLSPSCSATTGPLGTAGTAGRRGRRRRETLETLGRWSGRSRLRRWPRAGRRPKRPAPGSGRHLPSTARQSTPARLPRRGSCRSDRVAGWHRGRGAGHGNRRSREGERTQGASVRNMRGLLQSAAGANVLGPAAFALWEPGRWTRGTLRLRARR